MPAHAMRRISALDHGRELRVAHARLPGLHTVAGSGAYGCRLGPIRQAKAGGTELWLVPESRAQAELKPSSGRDQTEIRPVPGARGGRLLTVPVCLRVVQTEPGPMPTLTMSAPLMMRSSVISLVTYAAA